MSEKKLALANLLAGQLVGHHVGAQDADKYDKPTNIVTARNGIFRVVKTDVALFKTQIAKMEKDCVVPGASEMTSGVELLIPKIPFKFWLQVLQFYRDVHKQDKTEASVLFFWNHNHEELPTHYGPTEAQQKLGIKQGDAIGGLVQEGQLVVYCPRQKNSSGLSEFGHDGMVNYLRETCTPLLETHSHHTMDAFWSGTDDANENMTQFYGVYGKINDAQPKFLFRYVSGNHKINIDPSALFDYPQVKITTTVAKEFIGLEDIGIDPAELTSTKEEYVNYLGPWPEVEYPGDWLAQHTKSWTAPKTYNGYGGYTGAGYARTGYHSQPWSHIDAADDLDYDDYAAGSLGGAAYATQEAAKKNEQESEDEVETSTAFVQIQAEDIINSLSKEQIKELIHEISDYGYDYVIAEALEEASGGRFGTRS